MDVESTQKAHPTVSERQVALCRDQENLIAHVRDIAILEVERRMLLTNVERIKRVIRLARNHDADLAEDVEEAYELLGDACRENEPYRQKVRRRVSLKREIDEAEDALGPYEDEFASTERRVSMHTQAAAELRENIGLESAALGGYLDMAHLDVELAAAASTASEEASAQTSGENDALVEAVHVLERKLVKQAAEMTLQTQALEEQAKRIAHLESIASSPEHWWNVLTR